MKTIKSAVFTIVTALALIFQLMSPVTVHADGESTPPPAETSTSTVEPVDPPTESPTPDEASPTVTDPSELTPTDPASPTDNPTGTESPTETHVPVPTEIVPTESPTDSAEPTVDPVETDTPAETATLPPTESMTETLPVESPTPDDLSSTPLPTDSSTPEASFTPPAPATDSPIPSLTDPSSPTTDPVETSTLLPTQQEMVETSEAASTPVPASITGTAVSESNTPTETPTLERTPRTPETTTSTPVPTETALPEETTTVESPVLLESVQAIPGDTSVVILDANGQPLPLVTQAAADIVVTADPVWCPAGVAPTPGANGCTTSYTSLATLLADLGNMNGFTGIGANGTIWIEASYNSSVNDPVATGFTLDGSALTTWANYALTLQGGWNGVPGSTTIGLNSVFSVPITIANWKNDVTVNNITTTSSIGIINDPWGSTPNKIRNVTVNNVIASHLNVTTNSEGNTIHILNSSFSNNTNYLGAYVDGWHNRLIIENSHFDNNSEYGLVGYNSWGGITIANSTFDGNGSGGVSLNYATDVTLDNVSANGNSGNGMYMTLSGIITANNITTNRNAAYGAFFIGTSDVTLTGTNEFSDNAQTGLEAHSSNGAITLQNVTANANGSNGVIALGAAGVTLTGANIFNNNGYNGLDAWSSNGATSLENVTANDNNAWGAFVVGTNGVTLTGTNIFNNQYQGLAVSNSGNVTLNNVTANSNLTGVKVENSGNVTLNNVKASDNVVGVGVSYSGDVSLTGENISNNTEIGLYVVCVASLNFSSLLPNIINNPTNIVIDPTCPVLVTFPKLIPTLVTQRQGESFALDCENADGYSVNLPNGDLVQIFCPVSGRASISRRDSTALPGDLPDGYTYASAFQADIVQGGESIPVITEGGSIKASFVGSSLQPGSTYSILYWDEDSSKWIPLKDFMLAENGNPLEFELNPGVPDDTRKIKSGVKLVTVFGEPRVEVSTNFPGIFVLAQH